MPVRVKVAVVAGPDPGHAFPCLAVAAALRDRGHEVVFVSGDRHRETALQAGLEFRTLPLLAPTPDDQDLGHRLWGRPREMAPALAEVLASWRPDVVLADVLTRAGGLAAELLGRPWVEVSPHHLQDPSPDAPPVGLGRPPARTPWRRADDRRIRTLQERSVAAGRRQEERTRSVLGLPRAGGAPRLRLLATLPALEHPRTDWPDDAVVVGPLPWELDLPPLDPPAGDTPLVLVSDSTASNPQRSLAVQAVRAFAHSDLRAVVTTGRSDVRARSPNVVVGRGPHAPLLDEASVVVCPGGHGLVGKALVRGVPVLVVPGAGDQRETAGRIRHHRAGSWLPAPALTPTTLRLATLRLLSDPTFALTAARIGATGTGRGPGLAAALVEAIGAGEDPQPIASAARSSSDRSI